ncbi:hypothetical protein [Kocuria sp. CPCC 205261]|uniref:AbiTii domain-containing protein n=1 Tax=Kocuria sp. CPCC 205261 TaxID=3073554 RepID=UPI0034D3C103
MPGTLLEQIIADSTSSGVAVGDLLRKVWYLGRRIHHEPTMQWANAELHGYADDALVPSYRGPFMAHVTGNFTGPYGSQVNNHQLDRDVFSDEINRYLYWKTFRHPIASLESGLSSGQQIGFPWPPLAVERYNRLAEEGKVGHVVYHTLFSAKATIDATMIRGALDAVKSSALTLAAELQDVAPEAGEVAGITVDNEDVRRVAMEFTTNIYGNQNTIGQGQGVHQQVANHAQNASTRLGQLQERFGLSHDDAAELVEVVEADGGQVGEQTMGWLEKFKSGAVSVAQGVTVDSLVAGIMALWGMAG